MMIETNDGVLLCPHCGCRNLHHTDVAVFTRQEDAPVTSGARRRRRLFLREKSQTPACVGTGCGLTSSASSAARAPASR
jgi:hypothetical protein